LFVCFFLKRWWWSSCDWCGSNCGVGAGASHYCETVCSCRPFTSFHPPSTCQVFYSFFCVWI
jgi:hypothetical protein